MSFDLSSHSSSLAAGLSVVLASVYVVKTIRYRVTHKLPPGPKGIPFFGNLFQLSTTPWKEFEIWRNQYGKSPYSCSRILWKLIFPSSDSLMYISIAGTGILVLNSHKAAADLLERRGQIYSDRPRLISE